MTLPRLWIVAWVWWTVSFTSAAYAQGEPPQPQCEPAVLTLTEAATLLRVDSEELARLADEQKLPARRVGSSWRFSCAALMTWLTGDWNAVQAAPVVPSSLTASQLENIRGAGISPGQATSASAGGPVPVGSQDKPVGEAPQERAAEDIFLRGQRVLLGRGEVVVDFGQFYVRNDDHLLALIDGGVALATLRQQLFVTVLQGRVGIFNETEFFASTSYISQNDRRVFEGVDLVLGKRSQIGGVNLGIRRTLLREGVHRPDIVVTVNGHIPTNKTPYAGGGGLVLVKSVDPVALFMNANYLHAFNRDSLEAIWHRPEHQVDVSLGYGLALNDTLAISMAVSGVFTKGASAFDNVRFGQPSTFSGRLGLTSWLAKGLYVEPSVSFGLTGPGRSVAFGVTLPYSF